MSLNNDYVFVISRLLIVWLYESSDSANKFVAFIYNYIPQILAYIEKIDTSQCLVTIVIGIICLYCKVKDIDNILLNSIGYSDICIRLEYLSTLSEFNKALSNSDFFFENFTYSLVGLYKPAVQAVKMHFLKEITESAPDDKRDIAKILEAQEAVISMHYLHKGNYNENQNSELLQKINELETELEDKKTEIEELKISLAKAKHEQNKENRGVVQNMIALHEKIDVVEFENLSLRRENKNLQAKIERLTEEIKTYTIKKHEIHTDLKLVETKENLKIQINEVNYLKNLLAAKEKEYAEALEIIGKQ